MITKAQLQRLAASTARRCSSWTTTRCGELPPVQKSTCRACRPTTRSRPTRSRDRATFSGGRQLRRGLDARVHDRHENIKDLPPKERQDWIWDKIIYANPNKPVETLEELNQYKPLVTFDNAEEMRKIKKHAPQAGLALRLKVPNTGAMVELSSKFGASPGEAVDLILLADKLGLTSRASASTSAARRPTSRTTSRRSLCANIFKEARDRGYTEDEPDGHRRRLPGAATTSR
jgi:hypothetical protein